MKKKARGTYVERMAAIDSVALSVVSCYDNKVVTLLSNFVGSESTAEVRRFSKKEKQHIQVPCLKIVTVYNQHMGGVDLLDFLLGCYRIKIRSNKWYHRLCFSLIRYDCCQSLAALEK